MRRPTLAAVLLAAGLGAPARAAAQPSPIAVENARPGTADWEITDPALDREIEGYASATSVRVQCAGVASRTGERSGEARDGERADADAAGAGRAAPRAAAMDADAIVTVAIILACLVVLKAWMSRPKRM